MVHINGFRIASLDQLNQIKNNCGATIDDYALASAAASAVPVPGLDIAADVGLIYKMFSALRSRYSLDNVNAADFKHYVALSGVANEVFAYITKEGIMSFLVKYGAKALGKKTMIKYIPIIGQGVAAYAGYKFSKSIGETYSMNCYTLCREILNA